MLDLSQIESFYPESLRPFKKNLLREYLQYKILEATYDSKFGGKLIFMGGTAARIIHGNTRFSEDLDFDNLGLSSTEFEQLTKQIQRKLKLEGHDAEVKNVFRRAFTCEIKIPSVLFEYSLSGHRLEKLLIKLNTERQNFAYQPEGVILNKFDVFLRINVVPVDIMLAQKIYAIFNRPRPMSRDFYDTVFLLGKTMPSIGYLQSKLKIQDKSEVKRLLIEKCEKLDFKKLAKDVEPFLFNPEDAKKVLFFNQFIKGAEL